MRTVINSWKIFLLVDCGEDFSPLKKSESRRHLLLPSSFLLLNNMVQAHDVYKETGERAKVHMSGFLGMRVKSVE